MWEDNETLRHFKWKYRMDSDKCKERDVEKTLDFEGLPSSSKETSMFVDVTITWPKKENEINKFLTFTSLTLSISNLSYGMTPQFY